MITKEIIIRSAQACINSYEGKYGQVVTVFDNVIKHYRGSPHWYAGYKDDILYIVFRGTHDLHGWKKNFAYQQIKTNMGYAHKGFHAELLRSLPEIRKTVKNAERVIKTVIITGHSKGGSLALLCTAILKVEYPRSDINCIAFAPARVGNPAFTRNFKRHNVPTLIYRYKNDTVTHMPPIIVPGVRERKYKFLFRGFWPALLRYQHPVKIKRIGKMRWYDYMVKILPIGRWAGNPMDHYPEKYLEGVKKLNI